MTAKEMFRKLGYKYKEPILKVYGDRYFYYEDIFKEKLIIFYLKEKEVMTSHNHREMDIDMPTFKAIRKQLEELGWLDDWRL